MPNARFDPSFYSKFIQAVQEYLKGKDATRAESARNANEIIGAVGSQFDLVPGSLKVALSTAANEDNESGIISRGRGRGGGYWLNEAVQKTVKQIEQVTQEEESARREARVQRENALYEPVKRWLLQTLTAQRCKITANQRGALKWSNPDVVGLHISKNFGLTDIEITSVEVKISSANWRHDIFEAISHKRFANRVYYCYPVTEGLDKLDEDQSRYAELYKVGILQMYLDKPVLENILSGAAIPPLDDLDVADSFEVKIPAPYDFIAPRYQIEFLKSLGLADEQALWSFGSAL